MSILAAIDEKERSKLVVSIAYDLAETYDDTLVALHVVPRENFRQHQAAIKDIPGLGDFSIDQQAESAQRYARELVTGVSEDIEMSRVELRGRVGDIPTEILAEAEALDPRFLVISGRRRSPAGKALFGNTAQRILLNAECPVVSKLVDQ